MKGAIITYLLTYGGAAVSLFDPFYGLLVYIGFAIVKPESMWFWAVPEGNYSRIVAVALLAGWALKGFGNWNFGRARPVVYALLGFWGWTVLSACMAPDQPTAWEFVEELSKIVLPFLVGITTIDSRTKLMQLAWVIVLSEGYVAYELNMHYFGGYNRLREEGFGGFDNNCVAIALDACMGLIVFLGLDTPNWRLKALALAASALILHCILFSFSRGGMLGLGVVAAVSFFLIPKTTKHYVMLALFLLLAVRLAGPQVQERFLTIFAESSKRDESAQTRLELWSRCLDAMSKYPVLGLGPRHWHIAVKKEYGWATGQEAHTLWLQTGAELGVPGVLLLMTFYASCAALLWRLRRGQAGQRPAAEVTLARGVIAALAGFAVSAQFVSVEKLEHPFYITLLGAGILKLVTIPAPGTKPGSRKAPAPGLKGQQARHVKQGLTPPSPKPAVAVR